jgi:hypothetical protein
MFLSKSKTYTFKKIKISRPVDTWLYMMLADFKSEYVKLPFFAQGESGKSSVD